MKRVISLILSLALVLSLCVVPSFAQTSFAQISFDTDKIIGTVSVLGDKTKATAVATDANGVATNGTVASDGKYEIELNQGTYTVVLGKPGYLYKTYENVAVGTDLGTVTLRGGDYNGDGQINLFDIKSILSQYGSAALSFDLDDNGIVNIVEVQNALVNYAAKADDTNQTEDKPTAKVVASLVGDTVPQAGERFFVSVDVTDISSGLYGGGEAVFAWPTDVASLVEYAGDEVLDADVSDRTNVSHFGSYAAASDSGKWLFSASTSADKGMARFADFINFLTDDLAQVPDEDDSHKLVEVAFKLNEGYTFDDFSLAILDASLYLSKDRLLMSDTAAGIELVSLYGASYPEGPFTKVPSNSSAYDYDFIYGDWKFTYYAVEWSNFFSVNVPLNSAAAREAVSPYLTQEDIFEELSGWCVTNTPSENVAITGYLGTDPNPVVPEAIAGYTVKGIYKGFSGNDLIETVTLPDTIEKIHLSNFSNCANLKRVYINRSLKTLCAGCFENDPGFEAIYGYKDSVAEKYAAKYDINFVALDGEEPEPLESVKGQPGAGSENSGVYPLPTAITEKATVKFTLTTKEPIDAMIGINKAENMTIGNYFGNSTVLLLTGSEKIYSRGSDGKIEIGDLPYNSVYEVEIDIDNVNGTWSAVIKNSGGEAIAEASDVPVRTPADVLDSIVLTDNGGSPEGTLTVTNLRVFTDDEDIPTEPEEPSETPSEEIPTEPEEPSETSSEEPSDPDGPVKVPSNSSEYDYDFIYGDWKFAYYGVDGGKWSPWYSLDEPLKLVALQGSVSPYFTLDELNEDILGLYVTDTPSENVAITGYLGTDPNPVVPKTIAGYTVKGIFRIKNNDIIETVTLPDTIEKIHLSNFSNCANLKRVYINRSLKTLCAGCFGNDPSFEAIYGYRDSVAEKYAAKYDINFVALDEEESEPLESVNGQNMEGVYDLPKAITTNGTVSYDIAVGAADAVRDSIAGLGNKETYAASFNYFADTAVPLLMGSKHFGTQLAYNEGYGRVTLVADDDFTYETSYHVEIKVDNEAKTWSLTMTKADGIVLVEKKGISMRGKVDVIDSILLAENSGGGSGGLVVTNLRVSTDEEPKEHEHVWGEWTIINEPTLSSGGTARRECAEDASHFESVNIPALSDFSVWTLASSIDPTCESGGSRRYTSVYGTVTVTFDALGHSWGEWTITNDPTLSSGGTAKKICANNSSHVDIINIPALSDFSVWTLLSRIDPTCELGGSRRYTSVYGTVTVTLDALGHSWGEWTITNEPTLFSGGTAKRICVLSSAHVESVNIPALSDFSVWTLLSRIDPTCEDSGSQKYSSVYGTVTLTLAALGHSWGEWTITNEPTLFSGGTAKRICALSSAHVESVNIPALSDFTVWTASSRVAPTCENDGSQSYTSEYGIVAITLSATGHSWGEWFVASEPTYTEKGESQRVCKNDPSHVESMTIDALPAPLSYSVEYADGKAVILSPASGEVTVIFAAYKDGTLISLETAKITFDHPGSETIVPKAFDPKGASEIKLMLLGGMDKIEPRCAAIEYPSK